MSASAAVLAAGCGGRHVAHPHYPDGPFYDGIIIGLDHGEHKIRYQVVRNEKLLQGDMVLRPFKNRSGVGITAFALADISHRWPNRTISYCLTSSLNDTQKTEARDAMFAWSSNANVVFHDDGSPCEGASSHPSATQVQFTSWDQPYCKATVGYTGEATETVLITPDTNYCDTGTVMHEVGHLLGLQHEQSRPDRGQYIVIHKENIQDDQGDQFDIITNDVTTLNSPYDCASIMHYTATTFSKNGEPTITAKDPSTCHISDEERLSSGDIAAVRAMYK
jgi:hypothetical protein